MDALATTAAVWTQLPPELQRTLREVGGCEPHIFRSVFDGSPEEADVVVSQFLPGLELKAAEVVVAHLVELWQAAEVPARTAVRRAAAFSLEEAACARVLSERLGRRRLLDEVLPLTSSAGSGAVAPGSRAVGYWPNRLKRDLALMDDPNARAVAEVRERTRWTVEAAAIVQEARLPLAKTAELTMDPAATLARIAQGRRARTLRKRVRDWEKVRRFLLGAYGHVWPVAIHELIDFVNALSAGDNPRSAISSFMGALTFFEKGGGVRGPQAFAEDPLLKAASEEAMVAMTAGRERPRRQAPRIPFAVIRVWEAMVVDVTLQNCVRMYAWWLLLKVWGSLRFDDHRGLIPRGLFLGADGLRGALVRTKTSGAGKSKEVLPLFISRDAFVNEPGEWLESGFRLWSGTNQDRDYFLALPTEDLSGVRRIEATYTDAVAMSRVLLGRALVAGRSLPRDLLSPGGARLLDRAQRAGVHAELGRLPGPLPEGLGRHAGKVGQRQVGLLRTDPPEKGLPHADGGGRGGSQGQGRWEDLRRGGDPGVSRASPSRKGGLRGRHQLAADQTTIFEKLSGGRSPLAALRRSPVRDERRGRVGGATRGGGSGALLRDLAAHGASIALGGRNWAVRRLDPGQVGLQASAPRGGLLPRSRSGLPAVRAPRSEPAGDEHLPR